jgi:hypothetical protein
MVVLMVGVRRAADERAHDGGETDEDEKSSGGQEPDAHARLHVIQVCVGEHEACGDEPDGKHQSALNSSRHRRIHPVTSADTIATANVNGANRAAKLRPKTPTWSAMSLMSTAGPTTRNTSREVKEN